METLCVLLVLAALILLVWSRAMKGSDRHMAMAFVWFLLAVFWCVWCSLEFMQNLDAVFSLICIPVVLMAINVYLALKICKKNRHKKRKI